MSENRVGTKRRMDKDCIMRSFVFCTIYHIYYSGFQIEDSEMGRHVTRDKNA
jgi:hypothetical protein